jgi:hypothetical protein
MSVTEILGGISMLENALLANVKQKQKIKSLCLVVSSYIYLQHFIYKTLHALLTSDQV